MPKVNKKGIPPDAQNEQGENENVEKEKKQPKRKRMTNKESKETKKFIPKGSISLKQLQKYKRYLEAIGNAKTQQDQHELLKRMKTSDFKVVCTCMNDFLYDKGVMHKYFEDDETERLRKIIHPWAKKLKQFASPNYSVSRKKELLGHKQKGGSAILAAVIGSLLPMAVNAIGRWIGGKK